MEISFRAATAADVDSIVEFNCRLARETEDRELDREIVRKGVEHGVQLAPEVRYFVACDDWRIVGQLMLTREWSDWRDGWMLWLQSVYVISELRQKNIFRGLLDHALRNTACDEPIVGVRLYVEHENDAARACYRKLGFLSAGYDVMERPSTQPIV